MGREQLLRLLRSFFFFSGIVFFILFSSCSAPHPFEEKQRSDGGISSSGETAFVISRWEQTGLFGTIDVATKRVLPKRGSLSSDAVARYWKGYIFVVNRLNFDNIQVMDVRDFHLIRQYSVDSKSNPQDIVVIDEKKAYISRLASPDLLIVEPLTGRKLGQISLKFLAERGKRSCHGDVDCEGQICLEGRCTLDGIPELAGMQFVGDRLFVIAQRLDRNRQFAPTVSGKIVVIDTKRDKVVKVLDTHAANPTEMSLSDDGKKLFVAQVGRWNEGNRPILDGVIEVFDTEKLQSQEILVEEKSLGGNIVSFALMGQKVFIVRSGKDWRTELVEFDRGVGKVTKTLATSSCVEGVACFSFFQVRLSSTKELYLVDRNIKAAGIRIFDARTGKERTKQPINMELPPSFLLFYP